MKHSLAILFACLSCVVQAQTGQIKLNDLYIPNAPGFVLADKSPSSVDRPAVPRAFGISLLNLWQGGAVEATPYWLTNRPRYSFEQWVKKRFTATETFNLSVASFKTDTSSHISAGFRSQLFRLYSAESRDSLKAQEERIKQLLVPTDSLGNLVLDAEGNIKLDEPAIQHALHHLDELRQKGLFSFEVAGALLGAAKNNSYSGLSTVRSGIWANLRWSPLQGSVDFVGLIRYASSPERSKGGRDSAFVDWGVSLNVQREAFTLSLEYVRRHDVALKQGYERLAFVSNYALNENIILVASLGKNFTKVDNILTVFGIKFGLSRQQ